MPEISWNCSKTPESTFLRLREAKNQFSSPAGRGRRGGGVKQEDTCSTMLRYMLLYKCPCVLQQLPITEEFWRQKNDESQNFKFLKKLLLEAIDEQTLPNSGKFGD